MWGTVETLKRDGANREVLVHNVLIKYKRRGSGDGGDWYVYPPGARACLRSRLKFFEHFDRITVAAAVAAPTPAPAPHADNAGPASPGRAAARPWGEGGTRRSGYNGEDGTASVVLYQSIEVDDGLYRSKMCRQGRVLGFVSDVTDEEISAAAAEASADQHVYWAHFGEGTAAYNSATMAAKKFEADGIPTRTGRHGGDQWSHVEARVRVTAAEFGLEG